MADTVGGGIIGELGELGKKIGGEVAKVPGDIIGQALESVGASTGGKKTQGQKTTATQSNDNGATKSAWDQIDAATDKKIKRQMARRALEDLLAGAGKKQKEPSIWERLQMEADQKKKEDKAQKAAASQQLQTPTSKRPRGDLYGAKAKSTATENRNVRQD
jgi:hypothetical protein